MRQRILAATLGLMTFAASATVIPINNPSFEQNANSYLTDSWTTYSPGWANPYGEGGQWRPGMGSFNSFPNSAPIVEGSPPADNVPDGVMLGYIEDSGELSQVLSETVQPLTRYSLSLWVGERWNLPIGGWAAELWGGGTLLGRVDSATIPKGGFVQVSFDVQTGASDPAIGSPLEVRLIGDIANYQASDQPQVHFDNLQLTASPIPVPASFWLLSPALGALGWVRRRAAILLARKLSAS